jgi:hypothetical protein
LVEPPAHNRSVPGSNPGGPTRDEKMKASGFKKCLILSKNRTNGSGKKDNSLKMHQWMVHFF